MKINILITSISRKVWLIESFRDALKRAGVGGNIISADSDLLSGGLYCSDGYYRLLPSSDPGFLPAVLKICKKENIKLIIPTRDGELLTFAENKEIFEKRHISIMVSSPEVIKICSDKYRFYQFLVAHGIPTPKTYLKGQLNPSVTFPVIIKPRSGSSSKNVFKAVDRKELKFFLDYVKDPVAQEFIKGKEYTVDLFSDLSGNVITVVPRERIETISGESYKGMTVKDAKLIRYAKRLAEALGSIGHITIQCIKNEKGVTCIEVNPRFGGGAALSIKAGANTPLLLIKQVLGRKIKPSSARGFTDGLIMLRHTKDIFILHEKASQG